MKANRLAFTILLLLSAAAFQLPAQQTEIDRKQVEEVKAKAEAGDADSEYRLGLRYSSGNGVPKDSTKAVKWYRKAAEHNLPEAQYNLGVSCAKGQGVAKNEVEAVKWFRKAAEQEFAEAQFALGFSYYHGEGVPKNIAEGVKWYRKAAEHNLGKAQYNLGLSYTTGQGVAKDEVEAVKWFRRAAEQNLSRAQYDLGRCYASGRGVAKDEVEGYKWWLLAAAQGDELAKENVTILENQMSREQTAEGQRLARNFKPRKPPSTRDETSSTGIVRSRPQSSGSGFFITEDGYLITNEHVVGDGAQVRLVTAAGIIPAQLVKMDAANDLALLKAEGKFAALPVAASRAMKLGSTVATVGFPNIGLQGFAPKFARGEIGSLSGPQDDARYFQISVPVQPGNSGGALVDERGNVVGVVSGKLSAKATLFTSGELPENVNYAVKSSFLLGFLESVPEVAAKLKEPNVKDVKFADVVEQAKEAAVLVLVY
jgi:TPR repeat protein